MEKYFELDVDLCWQLLEHKDIINIYIWYCDIFLT